MPLSEKDCVPCRGGVPPLDAGAIAGLSPEIPSWSVVAGHHLQREFAFPDFATALAFVNRVGAIALAWGKVGISVWTHRIDGLTESDFILASKIDRAFA